MSNCLVCNSKFLSFFTKDFCKEYSLNTVHYDKCINCGLVVARELFDMFLLEWEILNNKFHSMFFYKGYNFLDKKWIFRLNKQAADILELYSLKFLDKNGIDYACGDGKLRAILEQNNFYVDGYDKYVETFNWMYFCAKSFNLVINTSFFEHARHRDDLDEVNKLVRDEGVLALHTLVCEEIPKDPNWFYLVPVHSIVYTNQAMQILFDQWGYKCSIYNPESRMWFWFKQDINRLDLPNRFIYQKGFVDYWK